jgi:hypothetical protein
MNYFAALLVTALALATSAMASGVVDYGHLAESSAMTTGSYTTVDQARRDSRYGVAEAEIVRIWPERRDGHWFYQEQALLGENAATIDRSMKEKPYFARVIHSIEISPGVVRRTVHRLKDAAAAKGAWKSKEPLAGLSPDDLLPSECTITVERVAEKMWRSTSDKCPNNYKGASYALSLGVSTEDRYANWDRGFAADGKLVWGPPGGGYIFVRKKGN